MKLILYKNNPSNSITFNNKNISIYLCGPTVYNHIHIGNARPIIIFDVLNRLLRSLGYNVNFLHNITDIDDKIIIKSNEENISESELSNFYYLEYIKILNNLNIALNLIRIEKVTTNIDSIIEYVDIIYRKNFAYEISGDIYFDTSKIVDYGLLSGRSESDSLAENSRLKNNQLKKNLSDFVLWKKTNVGLNWKSPWSNGRPGWHTECSCLINKYLGKQIDIHGGGIDLKFPHHENENAQNIAINDMPLSKVWMHIGHLNSNDEKMSKSLNNFYLVKDLLDKYDSNTIRWFFYQTSYSNPLNFSLVLLDKAKSEIEKVLYSLNVVKSYLILEKKFKTIKKVDVSFLSSLCDNFNFPNQISFILKTINALNSMLHKNIDSQTNKLYFNTIECLRILGIEIKNIHTKKNIEILLEWNKQKNNSNFEISDKLRKRLLDKKLL
ncbi:MAG: cysteine--tRNA ligase [Malacoplasma sp.]